MSLPPLEPKFEEGEKVIINNFSNSHFSGKKAEVVDHQWSYFEASFYYKISLGNSPRLMAWFPEIDLQKC